MLLLNITCNRKSYMASLMTLGDLERSRVKVIHFESLYPIKVASMLLLNTNRKLCMETPTAPSDLTLSGLERSNSKLLRF